MLYTPKFCSECGTEIENLQHKLLSSRRFCENCEHDFKGQKFLPLIWLGAGLLGIIYGFGVYLKKPDKPVNLLTTPISETASNRSRNPSNQTNPQVSEKTNVQPASRETATGNIGEPNNSANPSAGADRKPTATRQNLNERKQNPPQETVYICGAQTKKGTACSRRVKGGGRCWQHLGQPAILPVDKLVASQ